MASLNATVEAAASAVSAAASAASSAAASASAPAFTTTHILTTPALLAPIAKLNTHLLTTHAHKTYFPFPLLFVLHAVRCSFAWRGIVRANTLRARARGEKEVRGMTWAADAVGFLIMSWGGGLLAHFITGQIPPQVLHAGAALTYLPIHAAISLFLSLSSLSPLRPSGALMDVVMPFVDGATRAGAVALGVQLARAHSPHSLPLQIILGTLTACGGGQTCGTLGTWNPQGWTLGTPPALSARTALEGIDVWASLLATLAFVVLGGTHADVLPFTRSAFGLLARVGLTQGSLKDAAAATASAGSVGVLDLTAARALATLIITSAFVWRATVLHGRWAQASLLSALSTSGARSTSARGPRTSTPVRASKTRTASKASPAAAAKAKDKADEKANAITAAGEKEDKVVVVLESESRATSVEVDGDGDGDGEGARGTTKPVRRSARRKT